MEHLLEQKVNWDQSPKIPFFIPGSDLRFRLLTSRDQELPESLPWPDLTSPAANPEYQELVWRIPILVFPKKKNPEGVRKRIPGFCSWDQGDGKGIQGGFGKGGSCLEHLKRGFAGDFLWEYLME